VPSESVGGAAGERSLYKSADLFVFIVVTPATRDPLPEGQPAEVQDNQAVLLVGLSGSVSPPAELWEGDAGPGSPPSAYDERYSLTYEDASALIWIVDGSRVEILSNLSTEELQKVAEGLVPSD
jgi:hypothetical protein